MKPILIFLFITQSLFVFGQFEQLKNDADEGFVNNDGVQIHYLSWGEGPLVIMLHGFPDFWYSWRYIIPEVAKEYKVVAVDLRGYNLSDKPLGVENYTMRLLISDIVTVIDHFKEPNAILIANDWGGAIAWNMALYRPDKVKKLIACNIPFPSNIGKYINQHPEVGKYARDFQKDDPSKLTPEVLVSSLPDRSADQYYLEAFRNSSVEAMLNYYKASYPRLNTSSNSSSAKAYQSTTKPLKVKCPVLMIYGLKDQALPPGMMNNTWDNIDNHLTIYTLPDGGHFVQQEKPKIVNRIISSWLQLTN